MKLITYFTFAGNAAEVMQFYAEALNGKIINKQLFKEAPMPHPPHAADYVMHGGVATDTFLLYFSDVLEGTVNTDGNISVSLDFDHPTEMETIWSKLSEGGTVTLPLGKQFWGATFGMFKDKFGTAWMFNCDPKQ